MERAYHFREVELADEAAIDQWVQAAMMETLDKSHPPWRATVLRASRPGSRSAVFWQLHHSIGDGLALLFAFSPMLGCEGGDVIGKIPLPGALLPKERRKASEGQTQREGTCTSCCAFFQGAIGPVLSKHDSELCFNPPLKERTPFLHFNGRRVYTRFPLVPMASVKAIKDQHQCSVNDVLMAALTGALRRYGAEVRGDARLKEGGPKLEFKSMVMIGLPRPMDERDLAGSLANNMLFCSCPLPIDEPTPLGRLERTMRSFNNLKSKGYVGGMIGLTNFVKGVAPTSVLRKIASETFSKHSLLVTNVPCTTVPLTVPKVGGEVLKEMHMVFPNIIPQVSMITYDGHVNANLVADPGLFPEPEKLGRLWLEEFKVLQMADS